MSSRVVIRRGNVGVRPLLWAVAAACALAGCQRAPSSSAAAVAPEDSARAASVPAAATLPPVTRIDDVARAAPADLSDPSTYRLPGPLSAATNEAFLRQRFGADSVRVADVPGGEGETSRGIILFADDPERRAYLYFRNTERLQGLRRVRVIDDASRWRLENGIGIGMPLSRLVTSNGRPLRFSGFDWDYGGAISDWNGGRLRPADGDARRYMIRLAHGQVPSGAYPMGDALFSSDDPRYPRLGDIAYVGEIGVSFPDAGDPAR